MTTIDPLLPIDDRILQRLVDGELTAEQYRTVLERIDRDPRQWRHVALAFLQDQALGRDLKTMPRGEPLGAGSMPARRSSERTTRRSRAASLAIHGFTIAAGLVAAFLGGYSWNTMPRSNQPIVVDTERAGLSDRVARESGGGHPDRNASPAQGRGSAAVDPEYVTLVISEPGHSERQRVQVPIYPFEQAKAQWESDELGSGEGGPIPPDVHDVLERIGSRVTREQYWMPTTLPDGRDVVIPIDQVDIMPPAMRRVSF